MLRTEKLIKFLFDTLFLKGFWYYSFYLKLLFL